MIFGDEPPLPPDWAWHDSCPEYHRVSTPVWPVDGDERCRDLPAYFDMRETPNGSYGVRVNISCAYRCEVMAVVAGICWALSIFAPMTSNRPTRREEARRSWLRLGLAGGWRWLRVSLPRAVRALRLWVRLRECFASE